MPTEGDPPLPMIGNLRRKKPRQRTQRRHAHSPAPPDSWLLSSALRYTPSVPIAPPACRPTHPSDGCLLRGDQRCCSRCAGGARCMYATTARPEAQPPRDGVAPPSCTSPRCDRCPAATRRGEGDRKWQGHQDFEKWSQERHFEPPPEHQREGQGIGGSLDVEDCSPPHAEADTIAGRQLRLGS